MTKKQAKKLTLEVWIYLRDHPGISNKGYLPTKLYLKICKLNGGCPLCELFDEECLGCPLNFGSTNCDSISGSKNYYKRWENAKTDKTRAKYAGKIVEAVEAWEV